MRARRRHRQEKRARKAKLPRRKRHLLWAAAAAAMAVSAAITYAVTTPAVTAVPAPPARTVTVAALPAADLAGLYLAQADGLFARQRLRVIIRPVASTAAVITAQQQGRVDVAAGAYVPYIDAEAAGGKFRILAPASILYPDVRELVTTGKSPVTAVPGLKGKVIGVNGTGSVGTLLADMLLADHGLTPRAVRFITDPKGFPGLPGGLQHGRYAAVFLAEPYITTAELSGDGVLADLDQGGAFDYQMDGYVATQAWVQRNPGTAAAFIRAVDQGQLIAQADTPAVRAIVAQYDHLNPVVTAMMALPGYPAGGPDAKAIQGEAEDMLQFGLIGKSHATEITTGMLTGPMTQPVVSPGGPQAAAAPAAPRRTR
jgi:NitT/TauT family transport system substrate-binding protein